MIAKGASTSKPRGVLIAGNWKMNQTARETEQFFASLAAAIRNQPIALSGELFAEGRLRAAIAPPMLSLAHAQAIASSFEIPILISAQNAHWEKKGAFTGEISGPMLAELGINWVIIGHSERRQYFAETDATARKRTESLLLQGFNVILCIGETRAEREAGKTTEVLVRQLRESMPEPTSDALKGWNGKLVLAYEPVWAIGTGLTATPEQAEEAHQIIRKELQSRFGAQAAERTQILYGGSVTPENIDSLLVCANVDGALVGGASLKPESYGALLAAGARSIGGA